MFTTFQDGLDSFKTSNWSLTQEAPRRGLVSILFLILADLSSPISAGPFGHVRHQQSLTHFDIVLRKVYCCMYIDHLQRQSDCFAVSTSRSLQATGLLVCLVRCADIFLRKLDSQVFPIKLERLEDLNGPCQRRTRVSRMIAT